MFKNLLEVLIIIAAFAVYGYIHSYLASYEFKRKAAEKMGGLIAFYRLAYNIFALLTFYLMYILLPEPDLVIYDLPFPFDFITLIFQFVSLAGILWSIRHFSIGEFTGINQIVRYFNGNYNINDLDEKLTFRIYGPYRITRHPVYFFTIMFLLFRPAMNLFYLIFFICITAYFYIGSIYEEKKLVETFGEEYLKYQKTVPRIIPYKLFLVNPVEERTL